MSAVDVLAADVTLLPEMDAFFQIEHPEQPEVYSVGGGRWGYTLPRGCGAASGFASESEARIASLSRVGGAS